MHQLKRPAGLALVLSTALSSGCTGSIEDASSTTAAPPLSGAGDGAEPLVPIPAGCNATARRLPEPRIWRLTQRQLNNSFADLVGDESAPAEGDFFAGTGAAGFQNSEVDLKVRAADANLLRSTVKRLARETVTDADRLARVFETAGCDSSQLAQASCIDAFITDFGQSAFRRPLSTDEFQRYQSLYQLGVAENERWGVAAVIEAMLQSPKFLYRSELGSGTGAVLLDPFELASALSYTLTDSPPDAELWAAAQSGSLATAAAVEAEARRLLATDRARDALYEFYRQVLEYEDLEQRQKDENLFSDFEALKPDLEEETRRFVQDVVFGEGGTLDQLLLATHTFANGRIAELYGDSHQGDDWIRIELPADQRAGVLTQPGLMAHLSALERTSPVNRGRWVQERLLCADIPEPPPDVNAMVGELPDGLSRREQLEQQTSPAECAACHALMNPIGFGLEQLDFVGRWRTEEENGTPLDANGTVTGTKDMDGPFSGPRELAQKLGSSQQVRACIARQALRYGIGRRETEADNCSVVTVQERFAANNYDLRELAIAVVLTEAFSMRQR